MVLFAAAPASADPATPTNYRSHVVFVEGPGVMKVEIVGGDAFVRLTAEPGVMLEILGYEGEEYIRFDPDGTVNVNQRSPSKYLNDDRYANVELPAEADAEAIPRWEAVSADGTYSWHDHRTHWMSPTPPASVGQSERSCEHSPGYPRPLHCRGSHSRSQRLSPLPRFRFVRVLGCAPFSSLAWVSRP